MKRRASTASLDAALFDLPADERVGQLDQHDTPAWAAELIVGRRFADLVNGDVVLEPAVGTGAFLRALPPGIRGIGIEVDPKRAEIARRTSGHEVIVGDMRRVTLPVERLDAIITNPPWDMKLVDYIINGFGRRLKENGRIGMLIGAYAIQTEDRVLRYNESYSLEVESVPRRLFPNLIAPMVYLTFTKNQRRILSGFFLYPELSDIRKLPEPYATIVEGKTSGSIWYDVVRTALEEHGGTAKLEALYRSIEGRRPTRTKFWREQIRKVVQTRCTRVAEHTYRLSEAA